MPNEPSKLLQCERTWLRVWAYVTVALIVGVMLSGCITMKRPAGEPWYEPVDLALGPDSMAGTIINFECGEGDRDEPEFYPAVLSGCMSLIAALRAVGAEVRANESLMAPFSTAADNNVVDKTAAELDDETGANEQDGSSAIDAADTSPAVQELPPPADFTMTYVARGGDRDWCGWTVIGFVIFFGFFPCVEDAESYGEVIFQDPQGALLTSRRLHLSLKRIYGVPALYYWGVRWSRGSRAKEFDRDIANRATRYAVGLAYDESVRALLAGKGGL